MTQKRIGTVLHYWPKAGAAQIELNRGIIHLGDRVRIVGHGHDFVQEIESIEIDHVSKEAGRPGEFVAIAVDEPVHEKDDVFLVHD